MTACSSIGADNTICHEAAHYEGVSSERHGWLVCHETIDMFWHVCYGVRGRVVTFENCAIPGQIGGSTRAWRTTRMAAFPGMMTTSISSRVSPFMTPYRDSTSVASASDLASRGRASVREAGRGTAPYHKGTDTIGGAKQVPGGN